MDSWKGSSSVGFCEGSFNEIPRVMQHPLTGLPCVKLRTAGTYRRWCNQESGDLHRH